MTRPVDIRGVAAHLQADALRFLHDWLPGGKLSGREFVSLNPTRNDVNPGSFRINVQTGAWGDFATGDRGGDLVSLFAYLNGLNNGQAASQIAERYQLEKQKPEPARQRENAVADDGAKFEADIKLAKAQRAYHAAKPIWESDDHPYTWEKKVTPIGGFSFGGVWHGLRVGEMLSEKGKTLKNLLLIPMLDLKTGEFCALHRIFGWRDSGGRYPKGWCAQAGGVYPIGVDVSTGPVFACEGIATALSTYDWWLEFGKPDGNSVMPSCTVIAAMDSSNLAKQAKVIREHFAARMLIIISDKDTAGEKVARICLDAGFDGAWDAGRVS